MEDSSAPSSAEESPLVQSFWAGKLIQELHLAEEDLCKALLDCNEVDIMTSVTSKDRVEVADAFRCLSKPVTSLSPRVYATVCADKDEEKLLKVRRLLCDDCSLDWNEVTAILNEGSTKDIPQGFVKCATIATCVDQQLKEDEGLVGRLREGGNFMWMSHPLVPLECLSLLLTSKEVVVELGVNIAILLLTASLERALGDVFLSVSKSKQCPHLLRDLLAKEELKTTFSPAAMFLLRCLIGPPTGLNLRNILWHGFPDHKEIPPKYATLLLVLAASLGKLLSSSSGCPAIVRRPFVSLSQEPVLSGVFKELTRDSCGSLRVLFSRSYFILPSMLPTWQAALDAFLGEKYSMCLCLLLPSLEHGLRRVFACVNKCPERAVTAEADSLYTTLDEIFNTVLPNGDPNCLIEELGTAKLEMLLDLLVHPEGVRLRDRISHGEVEFSELSASLASHVLCVAVVLCAQYSLTDQLCKDVHLVDYLSVESHYVSLFHPISLLRKELENFHQVLTELSTLPVPARWSEQPKPHLPHPELPSHLYHYLLRKLGRTLPRPPYESSDRVGRVIGEAWSEVRTLFVSRQRLEVVGILRQMVANITAAIQQVQETSSARHSQFHAQQLRSRQRTNYQTLTSSLALYQECMEVLVLLVALVTVQPQTLESPFTDQIKFYKKVLQFTENFRSHCSPAHNRWEEANKLCVSVANLIAEKFGHAHMLVEHTHGP